MTTDHSAPGSDPDVDVPTPPPWIPPAIAGLDIIDVIARGGHGTVYRAHQRAHDRLVALKVLDAHVVDDTMRRRFDRERTALGRISDHPGIVGLLGSGYTDAAAPFLLLEFASGGTLADHLGDGPLDVDAATELAVGLAAALERTHDAGIVHNDIKPANIMRSAYGDWMLTDFGIASLVDRSATSVVHASYAHTAPETFDGEQPGPLADVYALASVLATCLTGAEPFAMRPDEAAVSAMRRIATEPYPDVRRHGVPDDLAAILEMALSKDPSQRPVSARAFAAALNEIRRAQGLAPVPIRVGGEATSDSTLAVSSADLDTAPTTGGVRPRTSSDNVRGLTPNVVGGGRRRWWRIVAAAAVLAVVATGAAAYFPTIDDDEAAPQAAPAFVAPGGVDDVEEMENVEDIVEDADDEIDTTPDGGETVFTAAITVDDDEADDLADDDVDDDAAEETVTVIAPDDDGDGGDGGDGDGRDGDRNRRGGNRGGPGAGPGPGPGPGRGGGGN